MCNKEALHGSVATGASSGIGRATVRRLAAADARAARKPLGVWTGWDN